MSYCNSLFEYSRFITRVVNVGELSIGGNNPIRVQSMTTTNTMDTDATVAQSIRMINAGCELVRITAPSLNDARNLESIKKKLRAAGYKTPLVADIHFTPNAAEHAARVVEKVRVNPGNYADKKKFENIDYTDDSYNQELERIRERFIPLVRICKEYGTAMRIGTNHGSLSDRILSRYGDTPLGMVESALEFLRICEAENYLNIVLSMKASNPQVMVQAYRLLVERMRTNGQNYPLHLGVTEAGDGEDGRIKSAVGIGSLLEDGLGDTIRVSLTEEPEAELPVAKALVERYKNRKADPVIPAIDANGYDPLQYARRQSRLVLNVGRKLPPVVISDLRSFRALQPSDLRQAGYTYDANTDKWNLSDQAADYILSSSILSFELPGTLRVIVSPQEWSKTKDKTHYIPCFTASEYLNASERSSVMNLVILECYDGKESYDQAMLKKMAEHKNTAFMLRTSNPHAMPALRRMMLELQSAGVDVPVLIWSRGNQPDPERSLLSHAIECGSLLLDGWGDGICLGWDEGVNGNADDACRTAFGILQATRTRISKTEYISCPSCGRTLFDLQETTAKIRERTSHLKGVKIGIMGCIVNGPGEMADADYGYVGTGAGKITLYKGKEVVRRNITSEHAVDELIALIKEHGDWIEKKNV